jgi:Suppressor of forked protein (Suf)
MHQKFVRRVDGKTAARAVFAASLPLRKSGVLGYEVYLAHAAIELHVNKEPEVVSQPSTHRT